MGRNARMAYPWPQMAVGDAQVLHCGDRPLEAFVATVRVSMWRYQVQHAMKFTYRTLTVGIRVTRVA